MSFFPPPHDYPPQRYGGAHGELSARLRPHGTPAELVTPTGSYDYLATGDSTNGEFGLYRVSMAAEPGGPGPHFHRTMSESFFVLSGTIRLYDGTAWLDGRPGDFLHVPRGGLHGFRNESGEPASMLLLFAPGAPREPYFEGLAEIALGGAAPSPQELDEFYARHDNHWA